MSSNNLYTIHVLHTGKELLGLSTQALPLQDGNSLPELVYLSHEAVQAGLPGPKEGSGGGGQER